MQTSKIQFLNYKLNTRIYACAHLVSVTISLTGRPLISRRAHFETKWILFPIAPSHFKIYFFILSILIPPSWGIGHPHQQHPPPLVPILISGFHVTSTEASLPYFVFGWPPSCVLGSFLLPLPFRVSVESLPHLSLRRHYCLCFFLLHRC